MTLISLFFSILGASVLAAFAHFFIKRRRGNDIYDTYGAKSFFKKLAGWIAFGLAVAVLTIAAVRDSMRKSLLTYEVRFSHSLQLVALGDSPSFSMSGGGSFFLGTGSFTVDGETKWYYVFYTKSISGQIRFHKSSMEGGKTVIYEEDREDAVAEYYYRYYCWKDSAAAEQWQLFAPCPEVETAFVKIRIPTGTVVRKISLDLK